MVPLSALSLPAPAGAPACCEDETWRQVPGWPHEASTCGRVRRLPWLDPAGCLHLGGALALCPDKRKGKGYVYATLRDGRRQRKAHVAVLVLEAHRRPRPGKGWEASHLRGVRTDNHLSGLAWETREQNLARIAEHAAEKAVTEACPELAQEGHVCHRPQVTRGAAGSCLCHGGSVTRQGSYGTGSLRPLQISPSRFTSVQPLVRALRTPFRSLRDRQAA